MCFEACPRDKTLGVLRSVPGTTYWVFLGLLKRLHVGCLEACSRDNMLGVVRINGECVTG